MPWLHLQTAVKLSQQGCKREGEGRGTYDSDDIIAPRLRFLQYQHLLLRSSSRKQDLGIFGEHGIPVVYRKLLRVVASQNNRFDGIIVCGLHLGCFAHRHGKWHFFGLLLWRLIWLIARVWPRKLMDGITILIIARVWTKEAKDGIMLILWGDNESL